MSRSILVPPVKCQGIKTKLVPTLQKLCDRPYERWIEPFCGSCVVALNLQPKRALLSDTNIHIIRLYKEIQSGYIESRLVRSFLTDEGTKLREHGESYFYEVRRRFNEAPSSLDFLFLNRSCFNGIMRFNRKGFFNTPYGHKPGRFAQAYVTKICNQISSLAKVISSAEEWVFEVGDFRETLAKAVSKDLIYADPPYAGRHTDYYNAWSDEDEDTLASMLGQTQSKFVLSTWHSNRFRTNAAVKRSWCKDGFYISTREHYYHVGSRVELRHPMLEAFVTNFPALVTECTPKDSSQMQFF